ncbi:MAG: MlaD family protein [Deltaproteobacteria bacterium]|jgi:phospholipid/cholesterol/gamma-HCH transport system substrate-binding protein|nr:MlaD family protein [Deltaproteobacteria bacterium]
MKGDEDIGATGKDRLGDFGENEAAKGGGFPDDDPFGAEAPKRPETKSRASSPERTESASGPGAGAEGRGGEPVPEAYSALERFTGIILFVVFTILILSAIIIGAGRDFLRSYDSFFVIFQEGYGLLPGVKVRFKGIDIGSVTRVDLMDNNKIRMELRVLSEYSSRVKGDSLATIKSPTIIGSEYIEIQTGSAESLPIPPGGQIPATDPKTVDQVLNALQWEDKLNQFNQILADLNSLTFQLQDKNGPIIGTFANLNTLSQKLNEASGSFGSFVYKDDLYQEILSSAREVRKTAENLNQTAGGLKRDVPKLTGTADAVLKQVESGTRSFPEISRGARESLRDVDQVLDSAKRNFLIRMNLSPDTPPESLTLPARGR